MNVPSLRRERKGGIDSKTEENPFAIICILFVCFCIERLIHSNIHLQLFNNVVETILLSQRGAGFLFSALSRDKTGMEMFRSNWGGGKKLNSLDEEVTNVGKVDQSSYA